MHLAVELRDALRNVLSNHVGCSPAIRSNQGAEFQKHSCIAPVRNVQIVSKRNITTAATQQEK